VSSNSNENGRRPTEPGLLDASQAAEFLGIAKDTLYRWVRRRKLPVVRIGRTLRFRLRSLEQFVGDHEGA
jgi:excisionase family DNA binding protein